MTTENTGSIGTPESDGRKREGGAGRLTGMDAERARELWNEGSYEKEAQHYLSLAAEVVEAADVEAGDRVLDVGCGPGAVSLSMLRRGADVTAVDVTPEMLEKLEENADIADVDATDIQTKEADAADLPFADDEFTAALSSLGHIYGDPPDAVAKELARVTESGGCIAFTSWTPTGVYPRFAGVVSTFVDEEDLPDFTEPPFMWGSEATVEARLNGYVTEIETERRTTEYPALSPRHFWLETAANSGLLSSALDAVSDDDLPELHERATDAATDYFDSSRNTVELEYLLAEATVA